jgi:hypothetical protein
MRADGFGTRSGPTEAQRLDLGHVGTQAAHVFHIRDGKVVKLVIYFDRERAFADLALDPEAAYWPRRTAS